ncbi:phosphate ABC transporter ATP-binding protein [Nitratidesulfovibrio sp. SRB-5]|uniref:phosphate ABC transporter ATP-binding protein n=1 Tax=Nitratidesulfovibrio sp. SRB-5 TaxID=2872636 RepID=UPI001027B7FB|nr:phosphate ABC transporter ATP-binding protein [Nitratidesulfovibrio sp. SRB-5]MBZ2170657.1 phosphate ABC transporter ATP-binding protein [Nitratidesulfovibrio sp. SRB-5]RXF74849.1 phosphate ABC transporter ATP-binding protein [Desulfovibrio sp. DS-1]
MELNIRDPEPSLRVTGLRVSFHGRPAVEDASLDLPRAGVTVLLGRSGSGKTTFLRALNRLNECFPGCETTGSILLYPGGPHGGRHADGTPGTPCDVPGPDGPCDVLGPDGPCDVLGPDGPALTELRRRVGMVFQTPNVLPMSVRRNLLLPLELVRGPLPDAPARMQAVLADVGLWDDVRQRLDRPAAQLSGGQQQRLCLARMLILQPDVLLLDEPTASLDAATTRDVEQLVRRLATDRPVLMVSHSLGQTMRLADRVVIFADGRPQREFTPADLGGDAGREALMQALL